MKNTNTLELISTLGAGTVSANFDVVNNCKMFIQTVVYNE